MTWVLGIDTGGTYTDAVLMDTNSHRVLFKAKALTTKADLSIGVSQVIHELPDELLTKICLVSLSTTLATNAVVESRGCKAGLILVGKSLPGDLPTSEFKIVRGRLDVKGRVRENLDLDEIHAMGEYYRGRVDALAISGYASVRNPIHELTIKKCIAAQLGIPIVCAHELTSNLGFRERTITALLNARLIPIIQELLVAVKKVLQAKKIIAPLMMVKSDGSLMKASFAEERPIETILSGPAASIHGAKYLSQQENALILDIGGTTSDIAQISDGIICVRKEGATVGGWLTSVRAVEACTFGIGGDSHIYLDHSHKHNNHIYIGPKKVMPLCVAASEFAYLSAELQGYTKNYMVVKEQLTDCYMLGKHWQDVPPSASVDALFALLQDGAHSLFWLAEKLQRDPEALALSALVEQEALVRISLTPTDIFHVDGVYHHWDKTASLIGTQMLADYLQISLDECVARIKQQLDNQLSQACLQSSLEFEGIPVNLEHDKTAQYFFAKLIDNKQQNNLLSTAFCLNKPIVAVGAPSGPWLQRVCDRLNTTLIVPEHAEVANAIGAAIGQVTQTISLLIRQDNITKQYIVHLPWSRQVYPSLQQAKQQSIELAKQQMAASAEDVGTTHYDILESIQDIHVVKVAEDKQQQYIETRIKLTLVGKPQSRNETN